MNEENLNLFSVSKWVAANEELPTINIPVLAFCKSGSYHIAWLRPPSKLKRRPSEIHWAKYHGGEPLKGFEEVKCWAELPEPPCC